MQVKVCGLRNPENIEALLQLPINYVGFIFYRKSPRFAGDNGLKSWIGKNEEKFGKVKRVGVFVNAEIEEILNRVHDFRLDFVQLHGTESPEYCRELLSLWEISSMRRARLIKAFSVDEAFDFQMASDYERHCSLFIFDSPGPGHGGTGQVFDWQLLEHYQGQTPFLLSGGIGPGTASAIRALNYPQLIGVDINSRFETTPGVKDVEMVKTFVNELKD